MKIVIEYDLISATQHLFATPFKLFRDQTVATDELRIPLQQRDYDWGNPKVAEESGNSIEELINDVDEFNNQSPNSHGMYFAGTILLENQNTSSLKLIDGQQRVTTLYLIAFFGYLIARYRLLHLPTIASPQKYGAEFIRRADDFSEFEKRVFKLPKIISENFADPEMDEEVLSTRLGENTGTNERNLEEYWNSIAFRLTFDDPENEKKLKQAFQSARLEGGQIMELKFHKTDGNFYAAGLKTISETVFNRIGNQLPFDGMLKQALEHIKSILNNCGLVAIISQDENDSFRLFEILNARGQDLSALDLIKNIIIEKYRVANIAVDSAFTSRWNDLRTNIGAAFAKGKADSIFVENLLRSEGSVLRRNKEISYLRNVDLGISSRHVLFKEEPIDKFFARITSAAEILREIFTISDAFQQHPKSALQSTRFMKLINYHWGYQAVLGANILHLSNSDYRQTLMGDWTNSVTQAANPDLGHFLRVISDLLLKMGVVGVVLSLSSRDLPQASREILLQIIDQVYSNGAAAAGSKQLSALIARIQSISFSTILQPANKQRFSAALATSFQASSQPKKNLIKVILYILYNQGNVTYQIGAPDLEHLEPANPLPGTNPYYSNPADRDYMINRIGNFALLDSAQNRQLFTNKPLIEKLRIIKSDPNLAKLGIFQNDLFRHIDPENNLTNSRIYGQLFPVTRADNEPASSTDSFAAAGQPLAYFFDQRSELLSSLIAERIFAQDRFLYGDLY